MPHKRSFKYACESLLKWKMKDIRLKFYNNNHCSGNGNISKFKVTM